MNNIVPGKAWLVMGNGRIGRLRGMAYSLFVFLISVPFIIIQILLLFKGAVAASLLVNIAVSIVVVPIEMMIDIRRLHDINITGWLALIYIPISFIGLIIIYSPGDTSLVHILHQIYFVVFGLYTLFLLFAPGTKGDNRFGPPPPPNTGWVIAGAITGISLPFVACSTAMVIHALQN